MIDEADARNAAAILENPMFARAIDALKEEAVGKWLATKPDAVGDREFAWMAAKAADRLREYFEEIVSGRRLDAARVVRAPRP